MIMGGRTGSSFHAIKKGRKGRRPWQWAAAPPIAFSREGGGKEKKEEGVKPATRVLYPDP